MLLRGEAESTMARSARNVVAGLIARGQSWLEAGTVLVCAYTIRSWGLELT